MKEVRIIVRVKNNILVTEREKLGLNQYEMARRCGICSTLYGQIENLKKYPVSRNNWSVAAQNIASVVGKPEEELFPEAFQFITKSRAEAEISFTEIQALKNPFEVFAIKETRRDILNLCRDRDLPRLLTPRESKVLLMKGGLIGDKEYGFTEIARYLGVSKARIREIYGKAIRKVHRSPRRVRRLKEHLS